MRYIFLLSVLFVSFMHAQEQEILSLTAITKKSEQIKKQMDYDRYVSYSLISLSVAHNVYIWVPLLQELFAASTVKHIVPTEKQTITKAIKELFTYLFYTKEGWHSIATSLFSTAGNIIVSNLKRKYMHPNTLRWYIYNQAPLITTLTLMNREIIKLEILPIDDNERNLSRNQLYVLYSQLEKQAEAMCAYSIYKGNQLETEEKILAQRAVGLMIQSHNHWLPKIKEGIMPSNNDFIAIKDLIARYNEAILGLINHFSLIEGESLWDKNSVIKEFKKEKTP